MECHMNNLTVIQRLVTVVAQAVWSAERANIPGLVLRVWVSKVPDAVCCSEDEVRGNQSTSASIDFFSPGIYHGGIKRKLIPDCIYFTDDPFIIMVVPPWLSHLASEY